MDEDTFAFVSKSFAFIGFLVDDSWKKVNTASLCFLALDSSSSKEFSASSEL